MKKMTGNEDLTSLGGKEFKFGAQSAFTLIELLVVISIIGILSSTVLTSLDGARQRARDIRRQTDLNQIQIALEQLRAECGRYPSSWGVAVTATLSPGSCSSTLSDHMSQVPQDPNGSNYGYAGSQNYYCLAASLESDNTPDNDADCVAENQVNGDNNAAGEGNYSIDN